TPGLFDNKQDEQVVRREIGRSINYLSPGPHAFLLMIKLDRFTEEDRSAVQKIRELFGEGASRYFVVLFTRGNDLSGSIEDCIAEADNDLKSLLDECGNRYHVFENKNPDDRGQEVERMIQERETELRKQYEEKLHQKEEELKAKFQKDMNALTKILEEKMGKLQEEGRERDLKMKDLEEKHKRELHEVRRFYGEKVSEVEESPELSPDGNEGEETSAYDNNTHGRKSKTKSQESKRGIVTGCTAADTPGHFVNKTSGNKRAVLLHHDPLHHPAVPDTNCRGRVLSPRPVAGSVPQECAASGAV
ncbi:hypothetical protein JZ751_015030, partial [Albula glossodonta]